MKGFESCPARSLIGTPRPYRARSRSSLKDLPHSLIVPPQEVRDQIAALDERLLREHGFNMNEEARMRELNHQTLNYYFDYLGHEVAYRETAQGPVVLGGRR